jgi:hypothetical protein
MLSRSPYGASYLQSTWSSDRPDFAMYPEDVHLLLLCPIAGDVATPSAVTLLNLANLIRPLFARVTIQSAQAYQREGLKVSCKWEFADWTSELYAGLAKIGIDPIPIRSRIDSDLESRSESIGAFLSPLGLRGSTGYR